MPNRSGSHGRRRVRARWGGRRAAALALGIAVVAAGSLGVAVAELNHSGSGQQAAVTDPAAGSVSFGASRSATGADPSSAGRAPAQPETSGATADASAVPATAAPVRVCGNKSILDAGPKTPPLGAIRVPAGHNARVNFRRAHKTYWFAPGVHTFGSGIYDQIDPGDGATFIGAPSATLDGQHKNYYAFADQARGVRISYLTIRNFGTSGGNQEEGVVNHDSASGWKIDHTTIEGNAGAGVMLGNYNTLAYDCVQNNQQYGFNAYLPSGPRKLVLDHNEIAGNDTYNWEKREPGCGCTGGGKFWNVNGAIITYNWFYDNHSVGLWADTNNRGFDIEHNYFQGNYDVGLVYEISYNALIKDNAFIRNGFGQGPQNDGFPNGAIYVSESGADPRVATSYSKTLAITGNQFTDNWSGVVLWENANRFCGSPDNSSSGDCTMASPKVARLKTCTRSNLQGAKPGRSPDYYDLCRWKTQNVQVTHNTFNFNPANIGKSCTIANGCGFVGVFSEWGSDPSWSPYKGPVVENNITFHQGNQFADNIYNGPWRFMIHELGTIVSWQNWRGQRYHEDTGSALHPNAG